MMTRYQTYYWKDPERCRGLQRAKYRKDPKRQMEMNRKWREANKEYFKALNNFSQKIRYEKLHRNRPERIEALVAMKEEFKSRH